MALMTASRKVFTAEALPVAPGAGSGCEADTVAGASCPRESGGRLRGFLRAGSAAWRVATAIVLLACWAPAGTAGAAQTGGGVNWIDPLQYSKPTFVPIDVPDEATAPKYYVNFSGGGGSSCTEASPCGSLSSVAGKPGTAGGPAYIYVKGTGNASISGTLYGSPGNEVVIKTWPGSTAVVTLQGPNNLESSGTHHLIFDGGPDLQLNFVGSPSCGSDGQNSNCFALNVNSNSLTFYRSQFQCSIGFAVSISRNSGVVTGTSFINSEFHNCNRNDNNLHIYPGGGNYCSGSSTTNQTLFQNNIFRDAYAAGIEFNPRTIADGVVITGNAFHNIGKGTCGGSWQCRPPIILDGPSCGGKTQNATITNNLIWDTGSGAIWDRAGSSSVYVYNNTIFDYGKGSGGGGPNPQGISGYSNGGRATVRNNVFYAPNGTNPLDGSSFVKTNNLCGSGESCASSGQQTDTVANIFLSTDPNSPDFLKPKGSAKSVDTGTDVGVSTSYGGTPRPVGSGFDIGAYEFGSADPDTTPPTVPGEVTATPVSTTQIDLAWVAATDDYGVAGYRVMRDGALAGTTAGRSFQDAGRTPGTTYSYTVSAYDGAGNESLPSLAAVGTTFPPDTAPPTTPSGLAATAVSSTRIDLAWSAATDNVGVTGYRVFRDGAPVGTTGALTYQDAGRSPGVTYAYAVSAFDEAGNESGASAPAQATTPAPDTTPPSPPPGLTATALSSTSVGVAWGAASDNVAVTGYRVYRDGALVASVGGLSYTDTGLAPDTDYAYHAVALDGEGNVSAPSTTASAHTTAMLRPDLVAAYGFNEGAGSVTSDQSGNGNTGTLSGTTWTTQGKYGSALSFDGTSSLVTVPDSSLLRLTTGMTVEAWVYPTGLSSWRNVLIKEQPGQLVYALYANNDGNRPTGHVYVGSDNQLDGTSKLSTNTWTHLAATYDGSRLRLYVNGAEVSSRSVSGSLATSTNPLRIGGNSVWGEYFSGRIDEIRIYRRALSAAEIAADMVDPVVAGDTTPPANPTGLRLAP